MSTNTTTWLKAATPPKNQNRVLVVAENENGSRYRTIAVFFPKGTCCDDYYEDPPLIWYNEETDRYEFQEDCWAESAWNAEEWTSIERVTHWAELPKLPSDDDTTVEVHSKETMDEVRKILESVDTHILNSKATPEAHTPERMLSIRIHYALAKLNPQKE